jgi:membrane-associated protein
VTDQLFGLISSYGLFAFFVIFTITSAGVPFPSSLMLIASGSFVAQGEMSFWPVLAVCSAGAIAGDQIGYFLGLWGGRKLVQRIATRMRGQDMVSRAELFVQRRGGIAIFLSRWLVTPLGPWLNLTSGATRYRWSRFLLWDVTGEVLWVLIYVSLGRIFSDRVTALSDLTGNLTWIIIGMIATIILGWKLFQFLGSNESQKKATQIVEH